MTIEVGFVPDGQDRKLVLGEIAAGGHGTFSDFSASGSRNVVSAFCLPDDSGGEVYVFQNEDFPENHAVRLVPLGMYTEQNRVATIPRGGSYEQNLTTKTRRKGRLVLTHLTSDPPTTPQGVV